MPIEEEHGVVGEIELGICRTSLSSLQSLCYIVHHSLVECVHRQDSRDHIKITVSLSSMLKSSIIRSDALLVNNGRADFAVLILRDTHLYEGWSRSKNRTSSPCRDLPLRWSNYFNLVGAR